MCKKGWAGGEPEQQGRWGRGPWQPTEPHPDLLSAQPLWLPLLTVPQDNQANCLLDSSPQEGGRQRPGCSGETGQ